MPESGQRPLKIFTSLQGIKDMQDKHAERERSRRVREKERERERQGQTISETIRATGQRYKQRLQLAMGDRAKYKRDCPVGQRDS